MNSEEERKVRERLDTDWLSIEHARNELEPYIHQVCARMSRDSDFRLRFVEARPKPPTSIVRKLDDKGANVDELYSAVGDLIGARVVVYNLSDGDRFRDYVTGDEACPLGALTDAHVEYESGYRAIHINGHLGEFGCEIQVRTAVQDAWAVTSRADVYTRPNNELVETLSHAQANILRGVDDVMQAIRNLAEKSRTEERKVASREEAEPEKPPGAPTGGLDDSALRRAREELGPADKYVLEGEISQARVAGLRAGIEAKRERSSSRLLFRAAQTYERVYEYRSGARFGNRLLAFKGPFVEGSNWAEFHADEFSEGLERHLLLQWGKQLEKGLGASARRLDSWDKISSFVGDSAERIRRAGGNADIVVVQGTLKESLHSELLREADWLSDPNVRGVSLANTGVVRQMIAGLPSLWIRSESLSPSLHVVDLSNFVYEETNPDAMSDVDLMVRVEEFNFESAVDMIDAKPTLSETLYTAKSKESGKLTREEAVIHLQLYVKLHIVEGGTIQERGTPLQDTSAFVGEE